jgi:hypothetical protein
MLSCDPQREHHVQEGSELKARERLGDADGVVRRTSNFLAVSSVLFATCEIRCVHTHTGHATRRSAKHTHAAVPIGSRCHTLHTV